MGPAKVRSRPLREAFKDPRQGLADGCNKAANRAREWRDEILAVGIP